MRVLLSLAILTCLAACGGPASNSEEQIRAWLAAGEQAAEDKDRGALMDMVSSSYTDVKGNDKQAIGNMLRYIFLRQNQVALITRIESLDVFDGTAAEVTMTVGMAGSRAGQLGFNADAYRFVFEIELDGSEWQLISARWGKLGESL
ncbi:MAG: hypothetical protein AAGF72_02990 [Pseudomonadota bacterium]